MHGSIYRFEGQVTVFKPGDGPCYRCLYPSPPPPELAPSCSEGGVLGVLPAIVGTLQTNEALKLALGVGEPLIGRLLLFDALATDFHEVHITRNPDCPVCGDDPTIDAYIDYVEFCTGARGERRPRPARASQRGGRRARGRGIGRHRARAARGSLVRVPGSARRCYDGSEIRPYVNVYVDGEDVRTSGGLDAPVRADATVVLLPAMAGGDGR